ncbi:hypothetical protein E2C01_048475 [Portunus trituberculatus]|uniref:Uncharacterized protein n=1 Tax=Portunus trituberculatus TaxID=210409 RepID=A0A5B7GDH3_PORTR|nr:hypothetical protein [Portunus trituberculatus]
MAEGTQGREGKVQAVCAARLNQSSLKKHAASFWSFNVRASVACRDAPYPERDLGKPPPPPPPDCIHSPPVSRQTIIT